MKSRFSSLALIAVFSMGAARLLLAAQLHLEPVSLDVAAPSAAGVLTLRNDEDHAVTVQSRVYRWSQVEGEDRLVPTSDVIASPPAVLLAPGQDYTVRVVRIAKRAVAGEETYRVWVDELPDAVAGFQDGINILVRQSVPVFFRAHRLSPADVHWSLYLEQGKLAITADNHGDSRLRIASLQARDSSGNAVNFGHGLAGYALGRSSIVFRGIELPEGFGQGGPITITAETNNGPVAATAALSPRP